MIDKYKKFLVIVAHPDDEVLGCGGFLKKFSKLRKNIRVIFLAEGSSCRFKNKSKYKSEIEKEIEKRKKYASLALKDLGIKDFYFYDMPCGKLNSKPITEISKIVEVEIQKFKPDIILTHSNFDVNLDHRTIFQACLQSTRPTNKENIIKALISFEILSSTEWKYSKIFEPNLFINIEKEIKYKIKALNRYKSEIGKYPHPRSAEGVKGLASYRGIQSHNKFAEAFKIIRLFSQ